MKRLSLVMGAAVLCLAFVWFFFFVPLGCGMNPTGCKEEFPVFSVIGLMHFWFPVSVALLLMFFGLRR